MVQSLMAAVSGGRLIFSLAAISQGKEEIRADVTGVRGYLQLRMPLRAKRCKLNPPILVGSPARGNGDSADLAGVTIGDGTPAAAF